MFSEKTSNRLQKRLVLLILAVTLGIGIVFSAVFSSFYGKYLENSLAVSTSVNMQFLTDTIDGNLDCVNRLVRWAQSNSTITNYVEGAYRNHPYGVIAVNAQERLNDELQNNPAYDMIHRVVVGNMDSRYIQCVLPAYSTTQNLGKAIPELPYFQELMEYSSRQLSTGLMQDPFYSASPKAVIPIIRPVYAKFYSDYTGWIFVEINETLFTSPMRYYSRASDSRVLLALGEHTYELSDASVAETDFDYTVDYEIRDPSIGSQCHIYSVKTAPNNQKAIIITQELEQEGCYVIQTLSMQELKNQNQALVLVWIVILILMLFIAVLLSAFLHVSIGTPIRIIRRQLVEIAGGQFSPNRNIEWNNELGDIGRGINRLAGDLELLIETRIADEKEKKDLEYKVLQNQINPHFLYNTLNSIKWMAVTQGADGIADMTTSLSRLLKSISKGTRLLIPLSEEIALIKDYFNIQNYRYGGTITMEVCCEDEALYAAQIIKFTLQPIVENAIFHGLEPKGGGCVQIDIHRLPAYNVNQENMNNRLEITVWDNGVGMSPEKAASLLASDADSASEFFREIGVANVHKRLQYEFGEDYGIRIDSHVGEYTRMHIVIPLGTDIS